MYALVAFVLFLVVEESVGAVAPGIDVGLRLLCKNCHQILNKSIARAGTIPVAISTLTVHGG